MFEYKPYDLKYQMGEFLKHNPFIISELYLGIKLKWWQRFYINIKSSFYSRKKNMSTEEFIRKILYTYNKRKE